MHVSQKIASEPALADLVLAILSSAFVQGMEAPIRLDKVYKTFALLAEWYPIGNPPLRFHDNYSQRLEDALTVWMPNSIQGPDLENRIVIPSDLAMKNLICLRKEHGDEFIDSAIVSMTNAFMERLRFFK